MKNFMARMAQTLSAYAEETEALVAQWEREGVPSVIIKSRRMVRSTRATMAFGRAEAEGISFKEAIKKEMEWETGFINQLFGGAKR